MQGMPVFHRGTTIEEEDTIMHRRDWLKAGAVLWGTLGSNLTAAAQNTKTKSSLIIDAHCHAGKGEAMAAPWSTFADPEVTLGRAQEAGIDKTIIFPINNPTYERANEEVAQIVKKYPGKFIGFAKHDPVTEAGKIKQLLSYEVKDLGLKGLKLHQLPTREVLDVVAALEIPILFHPPKVADYHMIAATYPQINFILAHLGSFASQNWSEHLQAIDVARRYPNVYLETSSVVFFEYLEMAARELTAAKLFFGPAGPFVGSGAETLKNPLL